MSSRAGRARALIAVCGVEALLVATIFAGSAGAAATPPSFGSVFSRCVRLMTGEPRTGARRIPGAAESQIAAQLSIFRATRTSADTLPAASNLGQALAGAQATTYDPSASIRLNLGPTKSGPVYAVPVTLASPRLPARCAQVRALAGVRALFALRTRETGSGPGICLITTHVVPDEGPVSVLPGKRPAIGMRKRHTEAAAGCESLTVMASYLGVLGGGLAGAGVPAVVVPDGVSSVTYAFAGGHQITAPVTGNLANVPPTASRTTNLGRPTRAKLLRKLDAEIPATVTEHDAGGTAVATFTRPASLISEIVREVLVLGRVVKSFTVGAVNSYVSCSARTHRCVAAVVSASCNTQRHSCEMSRRIVRYRYVGRRPPRGTTGHVVVPTGPIRARLDRYVAHPGKLTLVLSGKPRHRVDVVVSVNCVSGRHGETGFSESRQPLQVAVPSRTHLVTVGRHRACGVGVMVVSSGRGPLHARLARG
jgi:hypothetical protein